MSCKNARTNERSVVLNIGVKNYIQSEFANVLKVLHLVLIQF